MNNPLSLTVCFLVQISLRTILNDVVVEKVTNFKPIRIYEDLPARYNSMPASLCQVCNLGLVTPFLTLDWPGI